MPENHLNEEQSELDFLKEMEAVEALEHPEDFDMSGLLDFIDKIEHEAAPVTAEQEPQIEEAAQESAPAEEPAEEPAPEETPEEAPEEETEPEGVIPVAAPVPEEAPAEEAPQEAPAESEPEAGEAAEAEEDPEEAEKKRKKKLVGRIIYIALLVVFIAVFAVSGYYVANYMVDSVQNDNINKDLANLVANAGQNGNSEVDATLPSASGSMSSGEEATADMSLILEEYRELYAMNSDLVGWITVPDTEIDYPVMQSPNKKDYYLNHNFYGKYSSFGCIYAREECDVFTPGDNVVLYGHHMKNGSMFAGLDKYKKKAFWEDHQYFTFNTLYERHTYQVIAVFKTSANLGQGFSYHLFNTANSEEEFNQFIKTVHSLQMYKTGVTAEYGDMLLTLSTCEYTLDNGRFVVVAKRVE